MIEDKIEVELLEDDDDDIDLEEIGPCNLGRCAKCILLDKFEEKDIGYVPFETVGTNARILFVGEAPGLDEIKQNRPFIGRAGSFLREELAALDLKSYHLGNAMHCHPRSGGVRTPEAKEVKYCSRNIKQFINQNKPDLVILLGKSAYEGLMPESFYAGKSVTTITQQRPVEIDGIKYAVCFHPSYIVRNGGKKAAQYEDFVERLKSLITGNHKEAAAKVPFELKTLDNLKEVLASYMKAEDVGFDYESNSLDTFSENFKILGFSLATTNPPRATYVNFHRPITPTEKTMLTMFLDRKRPWTYNVSMELKTSWSKISNKFIPLNDSYILCKVDCSPGSLKNNARKLVGADFWEEILGSIRNVFEILFKKIDKLKKEIAALNAKTNISPKQAELLSSLTALEKSLSVGDIAKIDEQLSEDKLVIKYAKIKEDINELYKFCAIEDVSRGLSLYPSTWEAIPTPLTGEYCCYDSYYTLLIKDKLWERHKEAYPYYISQAWAGSVMEAYGMNWNDSVASDHEEYYIEEANKCLFTLINMLDFGEVSVKIGKETVIKTTDDLRLDAYTIMNNSEISPSDKLVELKKIFNPMSNLKTKQAPFWKLYTSDFVRVITYYYVLEESILASPVIPDKALELVDKSNFNKTLENLMLCDWKTFSDANEVQTRNIKKSVQRLIGGLSTSVDEHTGKFAEDVMTWQFRAHKKYGGLFTTPSKESGDDPDLIPSDQWIPEFKLLYFLRRFKKVIKSRTTYINGKIGRKNVWLSELGEKFSDPPKRIKPFFQVEKGYKLKPNERWILDTDFNVCGANTLRWRAAIHTVPANSELREIYEARSEDSLFMHYDNSQSEIRLLAALSQDKALLDAFAEGMDVHRFIASKIYKKPMDKVTDSERKSAKNASFALLYGKGIQAFAEEMMGGDLAAAEKLFKDFYDGFPQVRQWIDKRHEEAKETGKVTTLFGNTIVLDMADFNGAMRDAQNWPIQNGSSCLAAHCIYLNYKNSAEKNIPVLPMVFTHDSHDMEFYIPNLFEVIDNIHHCAVDIPREEFNIPMKIDLEIGTTQGTTVKLEQLESNGNSSRTFEFSSEKKTLEAVIKKLSKHFDVTYHTDKQKETKSSLEELFVAKKAFSKHLGTNKTVLSGKMTLSKK